MDPRNTILTLDRFIVSCRNACPLPGTWWATDVDSHQHLVGTGTDRQYHGSSSSIIGHRLGTFLVPQIINLDEDEHEDEMCIYFECDFRDQESLGG